jgi:cytochrome c oxidase assembly protein subunit 15
MVWLHRYAVFVASATVLLLVAGGLVTSTGSGLAVPDWPTTYGWSMFTFPLSKMVGGIYYEHGHRLIATTVGMLTIVLAAWLWWREPRRVVKLLGIAALGAVVLQGLLGGITVLFFLPAPISIAHAGLAQIFFCLTVTLALMTSTSWRTEDVAPLGDSTLRMMAAGTVALTYVQILVGATMRHTGAGLAIPDFPLAFGHLIPPQWTSAIAVHYAHRVGALFVLVAVFATAIRARRHHGSLSRLTRPATFASIFVLLQVTLGAVTVLSQKAVLFNTAHVVTGALLLASLLVLALETFRPIVAPAPEFVRGRSGAGSLVADRTSAGARA